MRFMSGLGAVLPRRGSSLGFTSWAREMASLAAVTAHPPPLAPAEPRGDGHAVLVIPGFLAGDWATLRLRKFLGACGYRVETAGIPFNAGPTSAIVSRLDAALLRLAADTAAPVSIVGQSLGGVLARNLARRHPGAVRCVVTLCSPIRFPVTTPLQPFASLLAPFHDKHWLAEMDAIARPLPVPATAIYSMDDGIVDWRQCLQDKGPDCENIRVAGSHSAIGSNPAAQAAIARALARPR
jgi:hypothetical protein